MKRNQLVICRRFYDGQSEEYKKNPSLPYEVVIGRVVKQEKQRHFTRLFVEDSTGKTHEFGGYGSLSEHFTYFPLFSFEEVERAFKDAARERKKRAGVEE